MRVHVVEMAADFWAVFCLVAQVMQHMSKCFQAIGKLKLDTDTPSPGQRPRALGMISCVGEEYVPFKTPLPLVDKVCAHVLRQGVHALHTWHSLAVWLCCYVNTPGRLSPQRPARCGCLELSSLQARCHPC